MKLYKKNLKKLIQGNVYDPKMEHDACGVGLVASVDGKKSIHVTKSGSKDDPYSIGKSIGEELQKKGIHDLALNWREKVEEWNKT